MVSIAVRTMLSVGLSGVRILERLSLTWDVLLHICRRACLGETPALYGPRERNILVANVYNGQEY